MKISRWLIFLGSLVLFLGALLHLVGYSKLVPIVLAAGMDAIVVGGFKAIWLAFSIQFLVLAPAFNWIGRRPQARPLLLFLTLIPVLDAALMFYFVGPFIGAYIVSVGAILLLIGASLLPRSGRPTAESTRQRIL